MSTALDDLLASSRTRRALPEPAIRALLRRRAGLSQGQIAKALGVSRAAMCRWESGVRTPRGANLQAYVDVLDRLAAER